MRIDARHGLLAGDVRTNLRLELTERLGPGAGHRLVRIDDDALETDGIA